MKKIYSLALVLALLLSLSTPALADTTLTELGTSTPIDVTGSYLAGDEGSTVYSVDITWQDLSFTYKGASDAIWDAENHEYSSPEAAGWTADSVGTITVTNHSNAFITLQCNYLKKSGFEDTEMKFAYSSYDCDSPNIGLVYSAEIGNKEQTTTITVTPDGTLPKNTPTTTIGSIRVTLNSWNEPDTDAATNWATSASNKLDELGATDDENTTAQAAIQKLQDATDVAESSDRNTLLAMWEAYIELSTIMTNLEIKYPPTT